MCKLFFFALVLTTASANFVQLGRTPIDDSSGGNYQWINVIFPTAFTSTPVVILGVPSSTGGNPAMGIVKDVTTTGFFFQIAEPSCYDEWHKQLKFDWMAVLPGVYTVDGSTFEAGIMTATGTTGHTSDFETITFAGSYATIPSVVAQIQDASAHAADEEYYINTRHHHLTTTSVGVLINEMANHHSMGGLDLGTTGASIGYVVMEETSSSSIQAKTTETAADCLSADPSATNCRGFTSTHIGGTHEEQATFVFSEALASEGFVFAQTITRNGGDHVTLRLASATGTAAASAVSGATDMTMFLEEPGNCWKDGSGAQPHPNEEAASYMVFTATAFADSIAALTATATVSFELQVSSYDQADLPAYGAAIALTLSLDASSVTVAELSTPAWSLLGGSDPAYPGYGCLVQTRKTQDGLTLDECRTACEDRSTCMSISYKTEQMRCKLSDGNFLQDAAGQSAVGTFSSSAQCRYYEYTRPPTALSVSFLLGGSDSTYPGYGCLRDRNSEELTGLTLEQCRAACEARSTCMSINYRNEGTRAQDCTLSDGNFLLKTNGNSNQGSFNNNNDCFYYEYTRPVTSRRLIEATSATLAVTVTTATAAVVEAAISTASFSGSVSTELETAGVTTTLTVDPGTVTVVAATCSVTCALVPITVNSMVANLVRVTHDTTSQHTHHSCYIESPSLACKCSCCNDANSNCDLMSNYQL